MKLTAIIEGLAAWLDKLRAIKDVDTWDGSASRWPDADAYCAACLIDVNAAAGREEKAQSHCMLPIREPDDSGATYVKQAVFAAAGGRGIGRVERPDDVPEDAWEAAVKAAANQIITAYGEMDEIAPDSIYTLAGKEPPGAAAERAIARAIALDRLYDNILAALHSVAPDAWAHMIYAENDSSYFLIASQEGRLYRADVQVDLDGETITVGLPDTWQQVIETFEPARSAHTSLLRQADGRVRWLSRSCVAALNRVGEIDSMALFDSFREAVAEHGWPYRTFYHLGETFRTGQVDFIGREGAVLITSGLYDNNELARREIAAIEADPGYWGESIHYRPTRYRTEQIGGADIFIGEAGYMIEVSLLPEQRAASVMTNVTVKERAMDERTFPDFVKLFDGDEDAARSWLQAHAQPVDHALREAGAVVREAAAPDAEDTLRDASELEADDREAEDTLDLPGLYAQLQTLQANLDQVIEGLTLRFAPLEKQLKALGERLEVQEVQARAWQKQATANLPPIINRQPAVRPRDIAPEGDAPASKPSPREVLAQKGVVNQT